MIKRFICISQKASITVLHKQLKVVKEEDIGVLVLEDRDITIAQQALVCLSEALVAVIMCDNHHMPLSLTLPLYAHTQSSLMLYKQIEASIPTQKQLWKAIVEAKIRSQIVALRSCTDDNGGYLGGLLRDVKSGDTTGREGVAAKYYFPTLFGKGFVRDKDISGSINNALNYGYSLLRSLVARAIIGAGMHPSYGIFHKNQYNPFNLVDDMMEPLRPMVDMYVHKMHINSSLEEPLSTHNKRDLLLLFSERILFDKRLLPLFTVLSYYTASFREGLTTPKEFITPAIPSHFYKNVLK